MEGKWLVLGDFNSYLRVSDKQGGVVQKAYELRQFCSCVTDCDLLEMGVQGDRFTWERKDVRERID